jgi:hypothetical protein
MKITHISPEFIYNRVYGTLSMKEKKSFFSSKLIKFDDTISIENQNIVYYQQTNHEQININSEILLGSVVYDASEDKKANSSLRLNPSNNSWILTINYGTILQNFIFATLKKWRTFEGVTNNITLNNDINTAINQYIKDNLLGIYELSKVELYISYNNIVTGTGLLINSNTFDENIAINSNLITAFSSIVDTNKMLDIISFTQDKPNKEYNFNYYFNLYFTEI